MSHATIFGSLVGAARLVGVNPAAPQAEYDRVRMAGTPVDAIIRARKAREAGTEYAELIRDIRARKAREARFAAMRAGK